MKKKLLPLIAASTIVAAALLPVGIASAVSYYPSYTCHYRDVSGSCLNYQTKQPAYLYPTYRYGRSGVSTYQNYQNPYYNPIRYEEDDDDNWYFDEDDDAYEYFYDNGGRDRDWRWYFDEDDDTYRPYRYQDDDDYYSDRYWYEYQHTRIYCNGENCGSNYYRY